MIEQKDRALFAALTVMYGIYVLPILLANRLYQDDLSRSLLGVTGWNNDARPLTEQIVIWLCGGSPINDIHPLPLLLSVLLLAYTVTLYAKRYQLGDSHMFPAICIGFLVIANPFLLSNLSYRFDCFTMILALCATILPYVVPVKKALWKVFLFSLFMCLITLTTYQPACGIYISLWFLEVFFMLFAERIDLPRLFIRGTACLLSVVLYKYFVLNRYIRPANGGWQPDAYSFAWRSKDGLFSGVISNFQNFIRYVDTALQGIPTILLLLFAILTLSGTVLTGLVLIRQKKNFIPEDFISCVPASSPDFRSVGSCRSSFGSTPLVFQHKRALSALPLQPRHMGGYDDFSPLSPAAQAQSAAFPSLHDLGSVLFLLLWKCADQSETVRRIPDLQHSP